MIEVVSAVIVRKGRILLTQRRATQDFPFCWESPGGKVEGNESHNMAVGREVLEEIGVRVDRVLPGLWNGVIPVRDHQVHVFLYPVEIGEKEAPWPQEGQGIGWFNAWEYAVLSRTPGNERAEPEIVRYMRERT